MIKSILSLFLLTGTLYSGADLSRDSDGIVSDISTNLEWQDDVPSVNKNWDDAIDYCEDLVLGGHDDWRLPNKNELISLNNYSKRNFVIKEDIFENNGNDGDDFRYTYRSSSSNIDDLSNSLSVSLGGHVTLMPNNDTHFSYVRCVRDR